MSIKSLKAVGYTVIPAIGASLVGVAHAAASTTADNIAEMGASWFEGLVDTSYTVFVNASFITAVVLLGVLMFVFRLAKRAITGSRRRR